MSKFPDQHLYLTPEFRITRRHIRGISIPRRVYHYIPEYYQKRVIFKDRWVAAGRYLAYEVDYYGFTMREAYDWLVDNYLIKNPSLSRKP
jgi:hypothetical protein